jgi:anthranilate synthase/aminodeoxychorismate synthase-like glutamine amidotransferase
MEIVKELASQTPILGVCLGHQCIAQALGGKIIKSPKVHHGKTSEIFHDGKGIYKTIEQGFSATRYHSLIVDPDSLPDCLSISAWTQSAEGIQSEIMGLSHRSFPHLVGVQFHPESILTFVGKTLLSEFVNTKRGDF